MSDLPKLTLHVIPASPPCRAARGALEFKGLGFEEVVLMPGEHNTTMEELYGARTVPGLMVGSEPVHGSLAIPRRLEELAPEPALYPEPLAERIREAEEWGERELQDLGRLLTWGAVHFRPERATTFMGAPVADPEGTDWAIGVVRGAWRYNGVSAQLIAAELAGLPAKLDHVDSLVAAGTLGGETANAADLQIGATLRVLLNIGDVAALIAGRPAERLARGVFPEYDGWVPEGAFPESWIP